MDTLQETKRNVEKLSDSLIGEDWDNYEEEDTYVNDYIKHYEAYIDVELNYYYKYL